MICLSEWIAWIIALIESCVQWLGNMQILGVSVLWIIIACILFGVVFRAVLFKP